MAWAGWNAHVHMQGAKQPWIGLGWGVAAEPSNNPHLYFAEITVTAPAAANATLGKIGINESVCLKSSADGCEGDGILIKVTYKVSSTGGQGQKFQINIAENSGQAGTPTGNVLKQGEGIVDGEAIEVEVMVPGTCPVVTNPAYESNAAYGEG